MIDLEFTSDLKPAKGRLLISEPFMDDTYFGRSVVYLCDYNNEGAFGFVLNKYLDVEFQSMSSKLPPFDTRVSLGGPVNKENLFFIHRLNHLPGSVSVADGIFAGGDFDLLLDMMRNEEVGQQHVKFFLGYSGWSPGQLDGEIEGRSWIVSPAPSPELILDSTNENLWELLLQQKGGKFKMMSRFPSDPQMN